jgi:hypothetical protein
MKVDKQLVLLAISSIAVLVFGTIGFYQLLPDDGVLTAVYRAVQLFSMESGVLDEPPTPPLIEIARWLALGTLIAIVYSALRTLLKHLRSAVSIARAKNHTIICGAGQRGEALARAFRKLDKQKVIVIESDESTPSLGELRNLGVEVVIGNAIDSTVLRNAGVTRAKTLIAVTGSDERNLLICTEVRNHLKPDCELSAGLESWAWRTFFLDRMTSKIRLDSYLSRATHKLMLKIACDAVRETFFREHGIRILIDAGVERRQELIRSAILMLQIAGEKRPILEVTSAEKSDEAAFNERFPAAGLVAELRWHRESAGDVFPEGSTECPDFAVFALSTEIETLEAAERFWMRHEIKDDRVIACLRGDTDSAHIESAGSKKRDFSRVNLLPLGLGPEFPLESDIENRAKICHAVYFNNEKAKNASYGANPGDYPEQWADLKERMKDSNRLAAMHHEVKQHAWKSRNSIPSMAMLAHLSRCEHMRWMAEKAMDGWRWSGSSDKASRDNEKLKHHLLIPFDALENKEKDKDYNAFLWALGIEDDELADLELSEEAKRMIQLGRSLVS